MLEFNNKFFDQAFVKWTVIDNTYNDYFCYTASTPGLSPVTVEETGVRPDRPGCLHRALTFKNMASLDIAVHW